LVVQVVGAGRGARVGSAQTVLERGHRVTPALLVAPGVLAVMVALGVCKVRPALVVMAGQEVVVVRVPSVSITAATWGSMAGLVAPAVPVVLVVRRGVQAVGRVVERRVSKA
jgi:hypothetical protein